ncbi:hypothetical protein AC578_6510 [Pseudocercospora eumusae]|uniref:Uncharacterized protein n=1 Tax=Pseudocercospora eumusae TaxID=321146 RepID=A0A139HHU2_9PEZI|nr:hypothetical protein AC578_6510 [Pseudocercospora eumusae]
MVIFAARKLESGVKRLLGPSRRLTFDRHNSRGMSGDGNINTERNGHAVVECELFTPAVRSLSSIPTPHLTNTTTTIPTTSTPTPPTTNKMPEPASTLALVIFFAYVVWLLSVIEKPDHGLFGWTDK